MTGSDHDGRRTREEELSLLPGSVDAAALESFVDRLLAADDEARKRAVRSLEDVATDDPSTLGPVVPDLASLLYDDDRSVRLTTAKLFVRVAEGAPNAVESVVPSLADRLADENEFYFVRARSAEALGYVALEHPDAVASPEVLADLRIGLSFDEPEVKEKLAKALEYVALGDPRRLRHQVSNLAEHVDDEDELVRYHVCTALVVVGCEQPSAIADGLDALVTRLDDENSFVRGRAAEALGLLDWTAVDATSPPESTLERLCDGEEPFVVERAEFALQAITGRDDVNGDRDGIGTVEGVRKTTEEALDEITAPDGDGECPHCRLVLPESGPPMCPRCGAPY